MSLVARAVFVLLVGATFAAFFVAQRLKAAPTVVGLQRVVQDFSPNGDGRLDASRIRVRVKERDDITVTIVDATGDPVRRLAAAEPVPAGGRLRLRWDGRTDGGERAPDGAYQIRVGLRRQNRAVTFPRQIRLDTSRPEPTVAQLDVNGAEEGDQWIAGPVSGPVDLRITSPSRRGPSVFRVLRTDDGRPREVARFRNSGPGATTATWDGTLADGSAAPPGTYLVAVTVRDLAGNVGTSPPLPPERGDVPGLPGLSVRRLLVRPPADPVRAGQATKVAVDSRGRPFSWELRRLGAFRPERASRRRTGGELTVRVPDGPSGVLLFEATAGGDSVTVPLAVQGPDPAPILVVLPAITWFGSSPLDDGRDGLPDTLEAGAPARWPRLLDGRPASLRLAVAPLLRFLDEQNVRYDVTTDLALAASRSGLDESRRGVLLPAPLRWVTRSLARRLRQYVMDGGTLASFGADTLRRGVEVTRTELRRPLPPVVTDPFGARLRPVREEVAGALEPIADEGRTGLLTGIDVLPGFTVREESEPVPDSSGGSPAQVLVALAAVDDEAIAAAEEAGEPLPATYPALTLSELGQGRVIRVGLPEWARRLETHTAVRQLTRNVADILRGFEPRIRFG